MRKQRNGRLTLLRDLIYGIIIGIANIIPGVSGGTMMVVLNIYDKFMYALSTKNFKKNLGFLCPLLVGCLLGLLLFSRLMVSLLENHSVLLSYCFLGIITGSIPMIYKRARFEKVKPVNIGIFVLAVVFMVGISVLGSQLQGNDITYISPLITAGGFAAFLWLFFSAAVSINATLLPGISGSFLMLLLGSYASMLEAIATFDFVIIIPLVAGALLGAFIGIKTIKNMLRNHPQALYFGILGLITGSLYALYPGFAPLILEPVEGYLSLVALFACAFVSYRFSLTEKE
ncbi:MAG: DUF368 domain-containing protein [Clostridia bacterium]|nr:DUF368 domain-containing protein [Clostridia bacterium]